jgi:hypothetical protein
LSQPRGKWLGPWRLRPLELWWRQRLWQRDVRSCRYVWGEYQDPAVRGHRGIPGWEGPLPGLPGLCCPPLTLHPVLLALPSALLTSLRALLPTRQLPAALRGCEGRGCSCMLVLYHRGRGGHPLFPGDGAGATVAGPVFL